MFPPAAEPSRSALSVLPQTHRRNSRSNQNRAPEATALGSRWSWADHWGRTWRFMSGLWEAGSFGGILFSICSRWLFHGVYLCVYSNIKTKWGRHRQDCVGQMLHPTCPAAPLVRK